MLNSKNKKIIGVLFGIGAVVVIIVISLYLFSNRCKYSFENKCITTSNFWSSFQADEPITIFTDNISQTIELSNHNLNFIMRLTQKEYPKRNEVLQYRSVTKDDIDSNTDENYSFRNISIGSNNNLVIYCYKLENDSCNLFEVQPDGNYKEKTINLIGRPNSLINISKSSKVNSDDINEVLKVVNGLSI